MLTQTQTAAAERIGEPESRADATAAHVDADASTCRDGIRKRTPEIDKLVIELEYPVRRHVVLRPEAARQLDELPKSMRARIHAVLGRLQQWPEVSGAKPLTGNLAGHFRVRTGDYRIQFSVTPDTLIVERVGHRDGFYEG